MKLMQIAILFIRITSVSFFIGAAVILTELPALVFDIFESRFQYITLEHEVALLMVLVRLAFYLIGGLCFLLFARPLARLLAKGLDDQV
jgi:hypothetical protein